MPNIVHLTARFALICTILAAGLMVIKTPVSAESHLSSGCTDWNTLLFDGAFSNRYIVNRSYHTGEQILVEAWDSEINATSFTLQIPALGVSVSSEIPGLITYTFTANFTGTIFYATNEGNALFRDVCGWPLYAMAVCEGDNLVVSIRGEDSAFYITGDGPGLPQNGVITGSYTLMGPGSWTGVTVSEIGGNGQIAVLGDFDCSTLAPPPPILPGIPVPNDGLIQIDTGQAQFVLHSPNGDPLTLSDGTPILLPADADHNGFDTYTVTGIVSVDGDLWVSIFLGDTTWGWVRLDFVTPLTPLELPAAE